MGETKTTIKTATGQALGVGAGNATAYVLLEFMAWKYEWVPDDPAVFIVMVGTLIGAVALQIHRMGPALKYVFDRLVPAKNDPD